MKPQERNYQTATQVKVLSSEISIVREADDFHLSEGNKMGDAMVRHLFLSRSLSPWYGNECNSHELGRSNLLSRKRIFANNLKRRECKEGKLEVGLLRSRGVTGVMFCEGMKAHSKGAAVICRGRGQHDSYMEMRNHAD